MYTVYLGTLNTEFEYQIYTLSIGMKSQLGTHQTKKVGNMGFLTPSSLKLCNPLLVFTMAYNRWRQYVMWSDKTRHMVQNWYLRYWYHVKVWIILFPELFTWIFSDTGIKSYWCSKAIQINKNIRIILLISLILQFHPLQHVTGFHRSHHIYLDNQYICLCLLYLGQESGPCEEKWKVKMSEKFHTKCTRHYVKIFRFLKWLPFMSVTFLR